jgi:hypothetical protein
MLEKEEYKKHHADTDPDFFSNNADSVENPGAKYISMTVTEDGEYDEIICVAAEKRDVATSFDDSGEAVLKIRSTAGFFNIVKDMRIYVAQVIEIAG